jgi:hypothetical protein
MAYTQGEPNIMPGQGQLPQGGATQANEATPTPAAGIQVQQPEAPVIYAPREEDPVDDNDAGLSENMEILAAPPDPGFSPNPMRPMGRVPRSVVRNLPVLMAASRDPEAPRAIKAIYKAITDAVAREG